MAVTLFAAAATVPTGVIVDDVRSEAETAQGYSLYLPSAYTPARAWPVIFAFDPRARGRTPVERYQAAAEKFGYIVAGSNNSRNGAVASSNQAAAMAADAGKRFQIDPKRIYAAGMSGGARVAMGLALSSEMIAGVIDSSAAYPDGKLRKTVPFVVFGTAGVEDFNHHEMRELDRTLNSPHRVAIFEGGHVWLPSELAIEAVEWITLQAMASGRTARNNEWIHQAYTARLASADQPSGARAVVALDAIVAGFGEFQDVAPIATRTAVLRKDKAVREAFKRELAEDQNERRKMNETFSLERQLEDRDTRPQALSQLRDAWKRLNADSAAASDSPDRRIARRMSWSLGMAVSESTPDSEYRKIVAEFAPKPPGRSIPR